MPKRDTDRANGPGDDWRAGDLALCWTLGDRAPADAPVAPGRLYRVAAVVLAEDSRGRVNIGLAFDGIDAPAPGLVFNARAFRKVTPGSADAADHQVIGAMRARPFFDRLREEMRNGGLLRGRGRA